MGKGVKRKRREEKSQIERERERASLIMDEVALT